MPAMVQSARLTVLDAGSPPVTVTEKINEPAVPVPLMVHVPEPTPVTVPLASTLATAGSLEFQVRPALLRVAEVSEKLAVPEP